MNRRGLAVCLIGLGLLLGALAMRNGTLALVSLPFIAYLAVGLRGAPSHRVRLSAERAVDAARTGDSSAVHVTVRVRCEGAAVAVFRLSDTLPDGLSASEGSAVSGGGLRPDDTTHLDYVFHAPRGVFRWNNVHVAVADPFRIFEKNFDIPAAGEIVVRPRVRRFRPFLPHLEQTLRSPGSILGGRAGNGTDFWGVREYQPGDQLRRLDWRRAARHPGRLFTREHEQEDIADFGLIIDAREQTNLRSGSRELTEIALDTAASLAEVFLRGGNRVGLVLLDNALNVVFPGYGKSQLYRLLRTLADVHSGGKSTTCLSLDQVPLRVFAPRALIVIVSPQTSGEWKVFPRLRARGNQGLLVSPDPVDFVKQEVTDEVGRLACRAAGVERRLNLHRVSRLGIRVIDWKVETSLAPLVRQALQPCRGPGGVGR